jgi:SAM-dependent methyltransferase
LADTPPTEKQITEIAAYIQRWDGHMDEYFAARTDVAGKRVLVLGSGWGVEVLWALERGAAHVTGFDPRSDVRTYLEVALAERGRPELAGRFDLHRATALTLGDVGTFDIVLSNNVLEHVDGLSANLAALARLLPDAGGRIVVFADPLFHSAFGHHLPIGAWEHLTETQASIRARVGPNQWREYRNGLNGMTVTDFLSAVREAGLVLLQFGVMPDRQIAQFAGAKDSLPPGLKPMDLCLEGISATMAFPHNL